MKNDKENILAIMEEKYKENSSEIEYINNLSANEVFWNRVANSTLIIFTYEAFVCKKVNRIIDSLSSANFKVISVLYIPKLSEFEILSLYKYHRIEKGIHPTQVESLSRIIPSIGWPFVRERYSHPCFACLVEGNNNIVDEMLSIKGCANPKMCKTNQIRFEAINQAFSLMHSSDDAYAVLRESIIFWAKENIENVFLDSKTYLMQDLFIMLTTYENIISCRLCNEEDYLIKFQKKLDFFNNSILYPSKSVLTIREVLREIRSNNVNQDYIEIKKLLNKLDGEGIFESQFEKEVISAAYFLN